MKIDFWNKKKNKNPTIPDQQTKVDLITEQGNGFYMWNGQLYKSDIIRACIRPKAKAIGKMIPKHIQKVGEDIKIDSDIYMKLLLEEPNNLMSMQVLIEKVITQLDLNNNAFIAIHRNENRIPIELQVINCTTVIAEFDKLGSLYLKFNLLNGKTKTYLYSDIIHIRQDVNNNDLFGEPTTDTLKSLMEVVNTTDQGIVKAVKNSSAIKWLLIFKQSLREEDKDKAVNNFTSKYLNVESENGGAIATDPKFDAKQVEPKDYVPNSTQMDKTTQRLYSFFNTNEKIVQSKFNEDEWNAYYESVLEPLAIQLSKEFTRKLFSRVDRIKGQYIMFEASNLQYASMKTKLELKEMVDRGSMPPNDWRKILNLPPIAGGDEPIRRLDTATVKEGNVTTN